MAESCGPFGSDSCNGRSNAPCRPGPRPLSCCQHSDRLSWIISYLPNLSLQKRAPFWGFKPCSHGSQAPFPLLGACSSHFPVFLATILLSSWITTSNACHFVPVKLPAWQNTRGVGLLWMDSMGKGRGLCLFGQMHRAICELLSVIKAADDVEQIHGPCLISPCSGCHPSS